MGTQSVASPLEDIEFLARSEHRVDALRRLRRGSADRDDLRTATGASKATVARLLNEFEERNWVVRDGHEYELTDLGRFVTDEFLRLVDRVETEHALRDVWQWFPTDLPGFTVELFTDAVISSPDPDLPYRSSPLFVDHLEAARTIRGFSARSPKPDSYEHIVRRAIDGKEIEVIFPRTVIEDMLQVLPEVMFREALESGRLTVLEGTAYPMKIGFTLSEDRLGLWGRDEEGLARVGLATGSPDALAWGESLYEEVRSNARPIDVLELLDEA